MIVKRWHSFQITVLVVAICGKASYASLEMNNWQLRMLSQGDLCWCSLLDSLWPKCRIYSMISTEEHMCSSCLGFWKLLSFSDLEVLRNWKMPNWISRSKLFGLQEGEGNEADSESDECILSFWGSIAWLAILTVFISILSEYLVDAIEVRGQTDPGWNVRLVLFQWISSTVCAWESRIFFPTF